MVISAVIEAEMTLDELTALDRQNYFSLISLYPNLIRGLFGKVQTACVFANLFLEYVSNESRT